MNGLERTIIPLDNMTREQALEFATEYGKNFDTFKVGLEMFLKNGPSIVADVRKASGNKEIFLDLKLHDIPNTVAKAISSLEGLPVKFLTVHLTGGVQMLKAAQEAAAQYLPNTTLLGVSVLTSLAPTDLEQMWSVDPDKTKDYYQRLFTMAAEIKFPGLVLSALELEYLAEVEMKTDHNFTKVCPGIRFQDEIDGNTTQDQKRVASPEFAISKGVDYLVIGRSLTKAGDKLPQRIESLKNC